MNPLRRVGMATLGLGATLGACSVHAATPGPAAKSGPTKRPILFFADIDGTLHGTSKAALAALQDWTAYWRDAERPVGSVLCYNTGRAVTDYERSLQPDLPLPDVLITGDGTEIRWRRKRAGQGGELPSFELDAEWASAVEACWDRVRDRLIATMDRDDEGHLADLNVVSNSPPRGEARWAITVLGEARAYELASAYEAEFARDGIASYVMGGWGEPRCHLVVALPASCGKLNAARHVQRRLGMADDACVAAGDSENDLPMVRGGYCFIMVANAVDALVRALDDAAAPEQHYRASTGYARGVIEGLEHFRRHVDE